MMGMKYCLRLAVSSTILALSLGGSYGRKLQTTRGILGEASADITGDNGADDLEQQLAWLCTDDPYLKYLHFNANLGTTSFEDCTWVAASPDDRCMLGASTSGRSEIEMSDGATTPYLLQDACPLTCGLCPTDIVNPASDLDREGTISTDDLTTEQIKQLEIRLRRQKRNQKRKRKGRKPCPCPDGQHDGGGTGGGGGGDDQDLMTEAPQESSVPRTTPSPSVYIAPGPNEEEPTYYPTFSGTPGPTVGGTQQVTSELTGGYTSEYTAMYTSEYTAMYTSEYTAMYTSEYTQDNAAVIGAVLSGQQSSVSNESAKKRLIVSVVSVIIMLLLVIALCCCVRMKRRRGGKGSRGDSDTDESDQVAYPIHKTKSANDASISSDESRFRKVLKHFNGRQEDSRTDVHVCTSAICEVCDNRPRRVRSIDSYKDEYAMSKLAEREERYVVKEVEC